MGGGEGSYHVRAVGRGSSWSPGQHLHLPHAGDTFMWDYCMCQYPSTVQAELVKFEDAVLLIQDYYCSLQGATPPQLPPSVRVPLIEVGSQTFSPSP